MENAVRVTRLHMTIRGTRTHLQNSSESIKISFPITHHVLKLQSNSCDTYQFLNWYFSLTKQRIVALLNGLGEHIFGSITTFIENVLTDDILTNVYR